MFCVLLIAFMLSTPLGFALPVRAAVDGGFTPPHSAGALDYDNPPNGRFDAVFVNVGITTTSGGQFLVLVNLGGLGVGALDVILGPGVHSVTVPVDADLLRAAGNGPYTLGLVLENYPTSGFLASDSVTTPAWTASDFDGPDVEIRGNLRNSPVDATIPPNGLYDLLEIEVPLMVYETGTYAIRVAAAGRFVSENITALAPGANPVQLEITANQIQAAGSPSGFGCLDLQVQRVDRLEIDARCSISLGDNATASKYEPTGASLQGLATDEGVDTDTPPDGTFDVLSVRVPLTVNRSGDYAVYAALRAANGTFVGRGYRSAYESRGTSTTEIAFSGIDIVRNQANGTLIVDVTLVDDRTVLGRARYTTRSYAWTAFDPLSVLNVGAIQDAYLDASSPPDGTLDEYHARIPINVDGAGTYRVTASIDFASWQTPQGAVQLIQSSVVDAGPGGTTADLAWPIGDFTRLNVTPDRAFESWYSVSDFYGGNQFHLPFTPSPPPAGAILVGPDATIVGTPAVVLPDANHDGRFDELAYDVNVTVNRAGPYVFRAYLTAVPNHNFPVTFAVSHVSLADGPQHVRLTFPGWAINASGFDGPFTVTLWYGRRSREPPPSETLWGLDSTFWSSPILFHWQFDGGRIVFQSRGMSLAPVIDGRIDGEEWADATVVDLGASDPGGPGASLVVANSETTLFVALDVVGDRTNDALDSAGIAFDVGEVGVPSPYSDDQISVGGLYGYPVGELRCTGAIDPFFGPRGLCQSPFDTSSPDRVGLAAIRGFASSPSELASHRTYEFSVPLQMLHVKPGETIGIAVQLSYDASGLTMAWPVNGAGFSWSLINNYARLSLAGGPPSPNHGGTTVAVFTVGIIAAVIGVTTVVTVLFVRNRRRNSRPPD